LARRVAQLEAEAEIARRLAVFDSPGPQRQRIYRFIESETAQFAVRTLCQVAQVSPSAYYGWRSRVEGPSEALVDEAILANRIFDIWRRSRGRYGAPRVTAALVKTGVRVNEKRVARIMVELGVAGKCGRRKLRTTWRDNTATPAADLVERDFTADASDELRVGDITYIPTDEGWLFVPRCSMCAPACWSAGPSPII
jgi:putative transposase